MAKHQEYRGRNRNKRTTVDSPLVPTHTCPVCGKQAYVSKAHAKEWTKKIHQGQKMRYYRCRDERTEGLWHATSMGAWATMRYKDWEANGQQPYEVWNGEVDG
jgi:hypothetical protein